MTTKTKPAAAIPLPRINSTYAGGEVMGVMAGQNDAMDYLLIDLGVEPEKDLTWSEAKTWAKSVGGELPTRREQSMMFGNRRTGQYQPRWYWSCEPYAGYEQYAWLQTFNYGFQYGDRKGDHGKARAVRRVPFQ
jgi:hypothetical protein